MMKDNRGLGIGTTVSFRREGDTVMTSNSTREFDVSPQQAASHASMLCAPSKHQALDCGSPFPICGVPACYPRVPTNMQQA
jgi:hypothetical protein